jgi:hypothetical protein
MTELRINERAEGVIGRSIGGTDRQFGERPR